MSLFNRYLNSFVSCIRDKNGDQLPLGRSLQSMLDVNNSDARQAVFERYRQRHGWNPAPEVNGSMVSIYENRKEWQDIVCAHVQLLGCMVQGHTEQGYSHLESIVMPFTKVYREDKEGWLGSCMVTLSRNMRLVALAADAESQRSGKTGKTLESCGGSLQKVFATAIAGSNIRKKQPVLDVVVTLFKIYFKLNTLRLCKNLIAAVERLDFRIFPASSRVTYKFYVGRLSIFDDQFEAAEQALQYALQHCHRSSERNKSRILYYLVPVKMVLGELPSQQALQKHHLQVYTDIVEAMHTGNVRKLNETLEAQEWKFIRAGTYLVLEKLKQAVLRRLLKKIFFLEREKQTQLHLVFFQQALEWQGMVLSMDEVECLVANLIYRGYVKGYISHAKRVLVCSKVNPFPALKNVNISDLF